MTAVHSFHHRHVGGYPMPTVTFSAAGCSRRWTLLKPAVIATQTARSRVATVGIEAMSFVHPVFVGDEVSFYCKTLRTGNTSITIHIESWARGRLDENARKVTAGNFTYVAIDENRHPIPIKRGKA